MTDKPQNSTGDRRVGTTQVEGVTADVVQTDAEVAEKEAKKVKDVKQEAKKKL